MQVHIILMFIVVLLNVIISDKVINRKKYILPFSFLIVAVYWSIRYDYGLDYWSYYNYFTSAKIEETNGTYERFFYIFLHSFKYFYQFIIAQSLIISVTLFYLVRKYISPKWYWLFFLLLFAEPDFHFNLISAMRSTMAACVSYWAFDLFYINKRNLLLFSLFIIFASLFHTSVLALLLLPLIEIGLKKTPWIMVFFVLIIASVSRMFYTNDIFNWLISQSNYTQDYGYYSEKVQVANFTGFLVGLIELIPAYFICKYFGRAKSNSLFRRICIIAFYYLFISMIGLDFQGRFSAYLFPFFIIVLAFVSEQTKDIKRLIMLVPYLVLIGYHLIRYYVSLSTVLLEGNPCFYHTIFEAPRFPF